MAFPPKSSVESLEEEEDSPSKEDSKFSGPPPASPKPRSASDSSLFSSAGKAAMEAGQSGLGAEGSDPALIGVQGLALAQRGIQMMNLAFADNPGLVAVLSDLTGRLQSMIPQLVAGSANQGMGLMSQMAQMMPMPVPNQMGGGMPPGMPPAPGGMPMGPAGPPQGMPGQMMQRPPVPM
jgi:hypothetical protein